MLAGDLISILHSGLSQYEQSYMSTLCRGTDAAPARQASLVSVGRAAIGRSYIGFDCLFIRFETVSLSQVLVELQLFPVGA